MLVNLSDAVAMNAEPKFALLGLGLPKKTSAAQISALRKGFADVCNEYGVTIIGGDTIGSNKILLSVTVISRLCGKAVLRSGAKKGDLVAFTGELGQSLKGLRTLLNGGRVASNSRFKKPVLKDKFLLSIARLDCVPKDFETLFKAYEIAKKNGYDGKLYIIRDGPDKDKVEKLKEANLYKEDILLLGRKKNKIYLEKTLGEKLYSFAYPYGIFNETSKKIVKELGFNYGIATDSGKFYIEDDLYQVRRIGIFSDITMSKFKRRVKGNYNLKYTK